MKVRGGIRTFILHPSAFILSALSLLLLVLGVRADDAHRPLAADDLAVFANTLDAGSHLHGRGPPPAGVPGCINRPQGSSRMSRTGWVYRRAEGPFSSPRRPENPPVSPDEAGDHTSAGGRPSVRMSTPSSVTATVCSKWQAGLLLSVTTVHSSSRVSTVRSPMTTMGSTASVMPLR